MIDARDADMMHEAATLMAESADAFWVSLSRYIKNRVLKAQRYAHISVDPELRKVCEDYLTARKGTDAER